MLVNKLYSGSQDSSFTIDGDINFLKIYLKQIIKTIIQPLREINEATGEQQFNESTETMSNDT